MPRKTDSDNPADWLLFAGADLETVRECLGNDCTFSVCQAKLAEAIEKLLKAELIRTGWTLLKTHDLEFLASELRAREPDSAHDFDALLEPLDEAYFSGRYPGFDLEDPDWPVLRAQLAAITALAEKIRSRLPPTSP